MKRTHRVQRWALLASAGVWLGPGCGKDKVSRPDASAQADMAEPDLGGKAETSTPADVPASDLGGSAETSALADVVAPDSASLPADGVATDGMTAKNDGLPQPDASAGLDERGGGSCPSTPEQIANPSVVLNLAVRGGYVVWQDNQEGSNGGFGHVAKVPVAGGKSTVLAGGSGPGKSVYPAGLALDDASVYWTDWHSETLMRTPLGGGASETLWSDPKCTPIGPVVLDGQQLYWFADCLDVTLLSMPPSGGVPTAVGAGSGADWNPGGNSDTSRPRSLAIAAGQAYWTNASGNVMSLPLSGGGAATRYATTTGVAGPSNIAVSGDGLFYTVDDYKLQARGHLDSGKLDGTGHTTIASGQNIEVVTALAVDADRVYWAVDNAIRSAPQTGGTITTIIDGLNNPRTVAVDDECVYWTEDSGGIWRVRKQPE